MRMLRLLLRYAKDRQVVRATGSVDDQTMDWLHTRTPEDPVKTVLGNFGMDDRGLP